MYEINHKDFKQKRKKIEDNKEQMKEKKKSNENNFPSKIKLDVGGKHYSTSIDTLTKIPDTILSIMFSGKFSLKMDQDGCYFIDRDGEIFSYILNFLRDGDLILPNDILLCQKILREAQYFQIYPLINFINEKLNFLETNNEIVPQFSFDEQYKHHKIILSNNNLTATLKGSFKFFSIAVVMLNTVISSGKHYIEMFIDNIPASAGYWFGVINEKNVNTFSHNPDISCVFVWTDTGAILNCGNANLIKRSGFKTGSTIGMLIDMENNYIQFFKKKKNGTYKSVCKPWVPDHPVGSLTTNKIRPIIRLNHQYSTITIIPNPSFPQNT